MKEIIRLENVSRTYHTGSEELNALKNVNLKIGSGEFVAVIGQSGSGKSTLMNILGCLDTADSGKYYLNRTDISSLSEKKLAYIRSRTIGFIFQSFNLIPTLSAVENVELPLMYRGVGRHERYVLAKSALEKVGLAERMYHKPSELSGGQQQRAAIARAIAAKPEILLADEPTGSLDKKSGKEVLNIIRSMNVEGVTVVMITHDNSIAESAKRCIKISDGQIIS